MPVLVTTDFPPQYGGIQRYMSAIADYLARAGSRVVVVAPQAPGAATFDAAQPYRVVRYARSSRAGSFLALARATLRTLRTEPHAYVVASSWYPSGLAVALVPRRWRGPLAILAHGTELAPSKRGVRRALLRWTFARADARIANSRFTAALLGRAGVTGPIDVIPCGVDPAPIVPRTASPPEILSVGRLVARKGFDRTLDALARLRDRFPEVRYRIVGDGPQRAALEARAAALGLTDRVAFAGEIDDDGLRDAYARAAFFVLPVRAVGDDVEGFGIVYLEAAMASLATIGGRDSGAADAIADGESGLLVDGEDVDSVAAAIERLLRDPGEAARLGARGFARALADFRWDASAAAVDRRMTAAERT